MKKVQNAGFLVRFCTSFIECGLVRFLRKPHQKQLFAGKAAGVLEEKPHLICQVLGAVLGRCGLTAAMTAALTKKPALTRPHLKIAFCTFFIAPSLYVCWHS